MILNRHGNYGLINMKISVTDHGAKVQEVPEYSVYDRNFKFLVLELNHLPSSLKEAFWLVNGLDIWFRYKGLSFPILKTGLFGLLLGMVLAGISLL